MSLCYKAVFIIPVSSSKTLDETGWMFEVNGYLRPEILDILCQNFTLKKIKSYLGMDVYSGEEIKATVIYDEKKNIEHISIQSLNGKEFEIKKIFSSKNFSDIEVFIPSFVSSNCSNDEQGGRMFE